MTRAILIAFTSVIGFAVPAHALDVIDFKGVGDGAQVLNFYNGGTDSAGNKGPNYGVAFTSPFQVDLTDHNSWKFDGPPYPVMFVEPSAPAYVNFAAGVEYFSFEYMATMATEINFYDGVNGTGNLIGRITLIADGTDCPDNPDHLFCKWDFTSVQPFTALIKSVDFSGASINAAFANLQFGSFDGGPGGVPEPASWGLMIAGFGLVGAVLRGRRGDAVAA